MVILYIVNEASITQTILITAALPDRIAIALLWSIVLICLVTQRHSTILIVFWNQSGFPQLC